MLRSTTERITIWKGHLMTEQDARAEAVTAAMQDHYLGENWGDDGVAFVGCDCGEWFGKAAEGGWEVAREHVAHAVLEAARLSSRVVEAAPSDTDREALVAELRFLPEFVQGTHNGKPLPLANFTRERIAKALTTAADALSRVSQPVQVEVTDDMVERAARRMAVLALPDSHTLDDRLTVKWQRYVWEAREALEAALGGGE